MRLQPVQQRQLDFRRVTPLVIKRVIWQANTKFIFTHLCQLINLCDKIVADSDFIWRIFCERYADGVTQAIAQ